MESKPNLTASYRSIMSLTKPKLLQNLLDPNFFDKRIIDSFDEDFDLTRTTDDLSKMLRSDFLRYLTGDLFSPLADIHFDLHHIPLEDNRFDVVFCNHVMEHVDDPLQCMRELFRVMKPGGWAIMQVPQDFSRETTYEDPSITSPAEREKHFWQKDHVRLFGKDYPQWLEKAGFTVTEFDLNKHFSSEQIERFRLMKNEVLYIIQKS
jgi:SAM-dependent methyltransferase